MSDLLTSAQVARLAGVGPTAVKRWADSGLLPCVRTAGGHRRFEREAVTRLLRSEQASPWGPWLGPMIAGDVDAVVGQLFSHRSALGSWHAAATSVGGLLRDLGERWRDGRLSVIEEHLASATLQRALARVSDAQPVAPDAPRCLLAAAEGDAHTLGLSLVEICLREAGWRSEWAGSPTRAADVVERVETGGLAMVALSAAASGVDPQDLERQAQIVGTACAAAGIPLAVGGDGAWPEPVSYGSRFHSLDSFAEFARSAAPRHLAR